MPFDGLGLVAGRLGLQLGQAGVGGLELLALLLPFCEEPLGGVRHLARADLHRGAGGA
jgi:hypothetical protein